MRTRAGFFMPEGKKLFAKPALALDALLGLLSARGLRVDAPEPALAALQEIGFYRLSAYMLPFQQGDGTSEHHRFQAGTTFEHVLAVYEFDARLRDLTFRAVSDVEVRFSAILTDSLSLAHGCHWFLDPQLFKSPEVCEERKAELVKAAGPDSKKTVAVEHYHRCYSEPLLPPSWVTLAAVEFGALSRLFSDLKRPIRKPVADAYGIGARLLTSWLQAAAATRNYCAHHQRLWNRNFQLKPAPFHQFPEDIPDNASSFYGQACILHLLARKGRRPYLLLDGLCALFADFDSPSPASLGFPDEWMHRPLWSRS